MAWMSWYYLKQKKNKSLVAKCRAVGTRPQRTANDREARGDINQAL